MKSRIASLALAGVATFGLSIGADAQTHHAKPHKRAHVAARTVSEPTYVETDTGSAIPLTVNRRSWLDPGNAVPRNNGAAGGTSYVQANTILNRTQDRLFDTAQFGNSAIVGPPYVPGREQPVIQGSLLPNGQPVIDTALLPQNFFFNPAPSVP